MGVRHDAVSGLYDEFMGLAGRSWTFAFSLADLLHKQDLRAAPYTRWLIESASGVAAVADVLCVNVAHYGMPEVRSLLTLAGVAERIASEGQRTYHALNGILAVCHAVAGCRSHCLHTAGDRRGGVVVRLPLKPRSGSLRNVTACRLPCVRKLPMIARLIMARCRGRCLRVISLFAVCVRAWSAVRRVSASRSWAGTRRCPPW